MKNVESKFAVCSEVDVGPVPKDNCINQASIDANKHTQQQTPTSGKVKIGRNIFSNLLCYSGASQLGVH